MDKDQLCNYYCDILDKAIFNCPVPFLKKYPTHIDNYSTLLKDVQNAKKLMYRIVGLEYSAEDESNFLSGMMQEIENSKMGEEEQMRSLAQAIKWKYNQLRNQIIKRQITSGGMRLIGHNWKLKNIVGNHSFTHKNKFVLQITLVISEGEGYSEKEQMIHLQLSIGEARELLIKLKQIRKNMKDYK